ncbi:RDD family protein [Nitrospirillum sp. BR 11163]|uniref:RDD family protein n=1 Tax=Nitrospirillum sp. BR 11163 TaxID=3104323 RepID=UPI002AFFFF31|nr:RDD family protein [Nitrospirillum sp. BR 11163]MEA1674203.1 RDD family protein [Nitrospirillum sp. BR 11163]
MSVETTAPTFPLQFSGIPTGWTYGGFWRRALAAVIDGLILFVASLALAVAFDYPLAPTTAAGSGTSPGTLLALPTAAVVNIALYLSYHTLFVASSMRATPGKRFMSLVVGRPDGGRVGLGLAFARTGVQELLTLPLILLQSQAKSAPVLYMVVVVIVCVAILVNYLMVAFTDQKTAGHDRICGTRVFKTPDEGV